MAPKFFYPGDRVISELPNGDLVPGVVIGRNIPGYEYDIVFAVRKDEDGKVIPVSSRHMELIRNY